MGIPCDDIVLIQPGKTPTEPSVVTINCPDKPGLGCDLCRIILEFGLCIVRGDFSTDGIWCYIVLWVAPHTSSYKVDWESLKNRLLSVCPSCLVSYFFDQLPSNDSSKPSLYLLKYFCIDRKGLLHDVTKVLTELEFSIQRVKVMTTPDGRVLDLFFITDALGLLHTKQRRDVACEHLISVLGEYSISCEIQLPGPEFGSLRGFSSLPPAVAEQLFGCELPQLVALNKPSITVDNLLSPAHTLLQIKCTDQKGLFYDILRTSKDLNIQIAYGRISSSVKGFRDMDLFIRQKDGKKLVDRQQLDTLCSHLKEEMVHPLRVTVTNRGPDTELLVANPIELSGKGRPRVFYDVTLALKMLGIGIFLAEIGRHSTSDRHWEVYRLLLDETPEFSLASSQARNRVVERVKKTLMGW